MTVKKRKRTHKNTPRLTAKERATAVVEWIWSYGIQDMKKDVAVVQKAIQAAVKQALVRDDRRDKR